MNRTERRFTFDAVASRYAAARPGYPDGVFIDIAGAVHGRRLLEVGAGPGKATPGFLAQGFEVTAVEPGSAMIAAARSNPALAAAIFEQSTFEDWIADGRRFDVVAAAQAWHWIDPTVGYAKAADLLAPGGVLAIFGNVAPFPEGPLKDAMRAIYDRLAPEILEEEAFGTVSDYYTARGPIMDRIASSGRFETPRHAAYAWSLSYGVPAYLDMISTYSDHQMLGEERLSALLGALREELLAHDHQLTLEYVTHLVSAHRKA